MVWNADIDRRWTAVAMTTLASAALFWLGTGLHPTPALTWVAALPVLLLAPRVSARVAGVAAFAAFGIGWLPTARYAYATIEAPLPVVAGTGLLFAGGFALLVVLSRLLMLRHRVLLTGLALPAGWVSLEYAVAEFSPHGAFLSIGYTQTDILAVLQVASATGVWGISFLLMGVPASIAVALLPGVSTRSRIRVGLAATLLAGAALGYGLVSLAAEPGAGSTRTVAALAISTDGEGLEVDSPQGQALLAEYAAGVSTAVSDGAVVVVLPEKIFSLDRSTVAIALEPLATVAESAGVDIVVGATVRDGEVTYNAAIGFPAGGGLPVVYHKQHLIPGLEDGLTPGTGTQVLSILGQQWALLVCKDLDYPDLTRQYAAGGAQALLVPAWDFDEDGWLHSRMAIMRGVENGLPVVRAARSGLLTVTDARGRVLAQTRAADDLETITVDLPVRPVSTLYTAWGDWFAWLCLALTSAAALGAAPKRKVERAMRNPTSSI